MLDTGYLMILDTKYLTCDIECHNVFRIPSHVFPLFLVHESLVFVFPSLRLSVLRSHSFLPLFFCWYLFLFVFLPTFSPWSLFIPLLSLFFRCFVYLPFLFQSFFHFSFVGIHFVCIPSNVFSLLLVQTSLVCIFSLLCLSVLPSSFLPHLFFCRYLFLLYSISRVLPIPCLFLSCLCFPLLRLSALPLSFCHSSFLFVVFISFIFVSSPPSFYIFLLFSRSFCFPSSVAFCPVIRCHLAVSTRLSCVSLSLALFDFRFLFVVLSPSFSCFSFRLVLFHVAPCCTFFLCLSVLLPLLCLFPCLRFCHCFPFFFICLELFIYFSY